MVFQKNPVMYNNIKMTNPNDMINYLTSIKDYTVIIKG